ncbi:hypothetical protein KUTeg_016307 [Tegillarca granosa]|uniref:Nuclear pore complex protein Nup155 n=1 Tax=Tegillarca granosa TaxID=220873 RepID=A0ABQ9EP97_TEGGR|nr:hypothetical protein KUTeg_016307 [Tegillarca granosa]
MNIRTMSSFLAQGGLPPLSHQDILESAGRLVDKHLQDDRNYLDLSEQLKVPIHNQPSVSGLHDFDYPSLPESGIGLECLAEVSNVKRVPLPPELVEQFGMQCNCMMGLFPDIERAWLTIDSDIFVWKYEDGTDLAYFDGLNETILSASLVKPKTGIFQPHIQYLLCLATHVDIVLLGVSFIRPFDGAAADSGSGEMHLLPEALFSIPTDNTYITYIIGSDNGRIFMAGKDGCLYELAYQANDGWFSRKCRKINHSKSSLSFLVPSFLNFSFSEDDSLVQLSLDQSRHILYARSEKGTIQVYDLGHDGTGMSRVAAIPLQQIVHNASHIARTVERSNFKPLVHISALTKSESSNVHLVAITQSGVRLYFTTNPFGNIKSRPCMLTLVHKPTNVHMAYHKKGILMLVSSQTEESDLLWTISGDSFPFHNQLMEANMGIGIDGRTWALGEVQPPAEPRPAILEYFTKADPPVVVSQHCELPRRFVLLTAQGSHILSKLRPVDQLRQLLIDCQGPDSIEVKGFFSLHKIEQACATCLILACSKLAPDESGKLSITFGGSGMSVIPTNIGPTAPGMGQPYFHPALTPGQNIVQDVLFSGKHNGICLYLGRILRLIWESNITTDFPCQTPQGILNYLTSSFTSEELNRVLENVQGLSDFVDFNSRFDTGPSDSMVPSGVPFTPHIMGPIDDQTRKRLQNEAQKIEKISLQHIQELIHRIEEVLGLLKILVDHQFHIIASLLTKDQQNQLRTMTFKQLVISGKEMCGALITCLIKRYLDDNATIDAVNTKLREICPSLYSCDDATCSKFAVVHFYEGIVDLCLTVAHKRDPQKLALHYYRSGEPVEDVSGMSAYMSRMECYNCITDTLQYLLTASVSHPQAPSVPKAPGPPPTPDPSRLSALDAEKYQSDVFRLALKSDDELFHVALYDWMFNSNLTEKLLEKNKNFPSAARILSKLAERHGTDVPLQQRIEYLSRALLCAKSSTTHTSSAVEGEFLHELEEKMEVARLQLQVQKALSRISNNTLQIQEAMNRLDSDLLDLTMLYEEFADRFELSECKLAIVHCAGLYDGALVENLWQNIIDGEIDGTTGMADLVRETNIRNKLVSIGKLYIKTERYYPAAFIIKYLEQRSCEINLSTKWVFEMMLETGLSVGKLLEIYDRMFKSRDPYWQTIQRPLRLLEVLCELLNFVTKNPTIIPSYERRPFTTLCLDCVSSYLVELQAMRSTEHQVRLVSSFKRLQSELERL